MGLGPFQPLLYGQGFLGLQDLYEKLLGLQTQANAAIYISGLVLSNNNPDSNDISWSACTVYLNGTAYPIAAGNTTAGAMLVWWHVGDLVFSSGNSFTPGPTTYAILTNNQGTADTTWDKIGTNAVQATQVIGNLLPPGYQIQPPASITLTGDGTTTLLSHTGAGAFLAFGFDLGNLTGSSTINFTVNVDGQGAQTYPIRTAGASDNGWFCTIVSGNVSGGASNVQVAQFNTPFKVSLVVQVVLSGGAGYAGQALAGVPWAQLIP